MNRLPITIALLLSCAITAADTLAPIIVEAELDSTAIQEPKIGEVVLEEYTGSHQRIESEQLQQAGASLGQLLSFETGVQHRQAGAEGSFSSITLRAASSAQTPIYWDGMLLNGAANPGVDLSDLELLNLQSVDIYRGTAPVQLGAGGIGGAVELRSPAHQSDSQRLRLQTGSYGSFGLQLGASKSVGQWQADWVMSIRRADNDFSYVNDNGTPLNPDDDQRQRRYNANFSRLSLLGKLSYKHSSDSQLDTSVQLNRRDQGVPEWRNRQDNVATYNTKTAFVQINQRNRALRGSDWNSSFGLYNQWRDEQYDDRLSQVGLGAQLLDSSVDSTGITGYLEHIGETSTLAFHLDARHETLNSDDRLENEHSEARRNSLSLTSQYSWFSADERLLLNPALRLQASEDRYKGQLRAGKERRQSQSAGLQLGAKYLISEKLSVQSNLGQHHREPGFSELFGDQGLHIGNENLESEKGLNFDISAIRSHPKGEIQAGVFINQRDDLIVTVFNAQGIGRSDNIGNAQVTGLELSIKQQLRPRWNLRTNLTYQSAENKSLQMAFSGKQLPGQAQIEAYLRLTHQRSDSSIWFESNALQDKFYDTANLLAAEDQLLHNIGFSLKRNNWQINGSIENVGDETVEDFNGFIKPGRSFHLSLQYQFNTKRIKEN